MMALVDKAYKLLSNVPLRIIYDKKWEDHLQMWNQRKLAEEGIDFDFVQQQWASFEAGVVGGLCSSSCGGLPYGGRGYVGRLCSSCGLPYGGRGYVGGSPRGVPWRAGL